MVWATRRGSLQWQTPALTSPSPKHMPGVTSWICSSEAGKHSWRWGRGRCLYPFQHVRSMKKTLLCCVHTRPAAGPGPGRSCQGGQVLLSAKWEPLSSCPMWKGWTLGLTKEPAFASYEPSWTAPTNLSWKRTPGTAESFHAQMDIRRKVTFPLAIYIWPDYWGKLVKKEQGRSVTEWNKTPLC